MFSYFLISSDVNFEKNALSEAAFLLSSFSDIKNFNPILLPVGGLGILEMKDQEIELNKENINFIYNKFTDNNLKYCFKITPLEIYKEINDNNLDSVISSSISTRISENDKWRITINKRHSNLKSQSLISKIASKINGIVDLKEPDVIIQLEIIGNYFGISLVFPYQILKFMQLISKKKDEEKKESDVEFQDE